VVLALGSAGCGASVHRIVVRTTDVVYPVYSGPVAVSFSREPAGGRELAIVQVYRVQAGAIERLVPEMRRAAADVGADFVKVDQVRTRFDEHEESRSNSYECGTNGESKTCTDTTTETVHEATTQLLGRAFRVAP
jgi:hypothetical protein